MHARGAALRFQWGQRLGNHRAHVFRWGADVAHQRQLSVRATVEDNVAPVQKERVRGCVSDVIADDTRVLQDVEPCGVPSHRVRQR